MKRFIAVFVALVAVIAVLVSCKEATAETSDNHVELKSLADEYGYIAQIDHENDIDSVIFTKIDEERVIRLFYVAEVPEMIELRSHATVDPQLMKYQGFTSDHQASDDVVIGLWDGSPDFRIYFNQDEYAELITALSDHDLKHEWLDYLADNEFDLDFVGWARYHGWQVREMAVYDVLHRGNTPESLQGPCLFVWRDNCHICGISAQGMNDPTPLPVTSYDSFGEAVARWDGCELDNNMLNSLQFWLIAGVPR